MSNITNLNRDYLIKINVKEATIDAPKMTFWNTDKKTSNMFIQLVINMSKNELIKNYVTIENATDYKITLNVIKPKTNQYRTFEATLLNEEKALFEIDLTSEFIDQVGNYNFEFEVSSKVDNNDESITTSSSTYEVKGSILTNLNEEISSSPDLPILKQLIEQVKQLQGGDLTDYQKKSDAVQKTTVEDGKLYLTKSDGTKLDDGTALPAGSGTSIDDVNTSTDKTWSSSKIDSQFKDIATKMDEISNPFNINSFTVSPSTAQKGSTINVTVKWSYNKDINSQTLNNTTLDATLREKTFSSVNVDTTYTLNSTSTNNISKAKSGTVKFYNGIYYGKSSSATYDSSIINSLTKVLSDSKARTITVNAGTGEYIYYCLPSRLGIPNFNVGGFDGGFNKVATVNFTNSDNFSENYDIYKSNNVNLGNTTIVIK